MVTLVEPGHLCSVMPSCVSICSRAEARELLVLLVQ